MMSRMRLGWLAAGAAFLSGCQAPDWGGAAGTALGAAGGAAATHGSALGTGVGALAGGLAGSALSATARAGYQQGLDDGYLQGSSDAVKRLYWAKQRLEQPVAPGNDPAAILAAVAGPSEPGPNSPR